MEQPIVQRTNCNNKGTNNKNAFERLRHIIKRFIAIVIFTVKAENDIPKQGNYKYKFPYKWSENLIIGDVPK